MKRILIIRFTSLGDLVTLEPTFRAIKYFFKEYTIDFLTSSIGKDLYKDSIYFDNYYINKNYLQTVKELKINTYDIVFNLQCHKPSHYIVMMLNKKLVVNQSYSLIQKIFNIKISSKTIQEILLACNIDKTLVNKYFLEDNGKRRLPFQKSKYDFKNMVNNKIIAISTGSSERWLSKQWGIKKYEELIYYLVNNDIQIILVGTVLEIEDSNRIVNKFGNKIFNLVNKTSLTELKSILSEVDLYIGNDSGPSHIAAGVGTNTITIFGSTDIKHCVKFMNYEGEHFYCKPNKNIICHPCYKTKCPTMMECMENIKVEDVLNKALKILNIKDI